MNKTFSINLDGRPFVIDEDAYGMLAEYLRQIKIRQASAETIMDVERRIAERFSERGAPIIDLQAVREATDYIGTPDQFGTPVSEPATTQPKPKRLYRSRTDRVIGGVCGGLGEYFGIDSLAVRLVFLILLFFGGGLILYIVFWIIIPQKPVTFMNGRQNPGE